MEQQNIDKSNWEETYPGSGIYVPSKELDKNLRKIFDIALKTIQNLQHEKRSE